MKKELPVYELYIADNNFDGITAMGLVDRPAIGQDFIYFKKDKDKTKYIMANVDVEKRITVGPAMIPNKKIIRQDLDGELYYVTFSEETIEQLAHQYLKESNLHMTTEQHEFPIKDIYMIESWIVKNESDKIYTEYGYSPENVTIGSWCIMYKIDNDDTLAKIKSGEIRGFSIEGYLSEKLVMKSQVDLLLKKVDEYENKEELVELLKNAQKNV